MSVRIGARSDFPEQLVLGVIRPSHSTTVQLSARLAVASSVIGIGQTREQRRSRTEFDYADLLIGDIVGERRSAAIPVSVNGSSIGRVVAKRRPFAKTVDDAGDSAHGIVSIGHSTAIGENEL